MNNRRKTSEKHISDENSDNGKYLSLSEELSYQDRSWDIPCELLSTNSKLNKGRAEKTWRQNEEAGGNATDFTLED